MECFGRENDTIVTNKDIETYDTQDHSLLLVRKGLDASVASALYRGMEETVA